MLHVEPTRIPQEGTNSPNSPTLKKRTKKSPTIIRKPAKQQSINANARSSSPRHDRAAPKNITWQICHRKPSSKRKAHFVLPVESYQDNDAPLLEMLIVEGFCSMNKTIRSKLFVKSESHDAKWKQAKWFHERGPVFAALSLIRAWLKEEKNPIWCKQNGLSVGAMHVLWEQCSRHLSALSIPKSEGLQLEKLQMHENEAMVDRQIYEHLLKSSKMDDGYVYSGEKDTGYVCLLSGERKQIKYEHGFCALGQTPKYVMLLRDTNGDQLCTLWLDSESMANLVEKNFGFSLADIEKRIRVDHTSSPHLGIQTKKLVRSELKHLIANKDVSISTQGSTIAINSPGDHIPEVVDKLVQNAVTKARKTFLGVEMDIKKQGLAIVGTGSFGDGMSCSSLSMHSKRHRLYVPNASKNSSNIEAMNKLHKIAGIHVMPLFNSEIIDGLYVSCSDDATMEKLCSEYGAKVIHTPLSLIHTQYQRHDVDFVQPMEIQVQVYKPKDQPPKRLISSVYYAMRITPYQSSVVIYITDDIPKQEKITLTVIFNRSCPNCLNLLNRLFTTQINGKPTTILNRDEIEKQVNNLEIIIPDAVYPLLAKTLKGRLAVVDQHSPEQWFRTTRPNTGFVHVFVKTSTRMAMNEVVQTAKSLLEPCEIQIEGNFPENAFVDTSGELFLRHVMTRSETYIAYDIQRNCLQVYGLPTSRNTAETLLTDRDLPIDNWNVCKIGHEDGDIDIEEFRQKIVTRYDPYQKTIQGVTDIEAITLDNGYILFNAKKNLQEYVDMDTSKPTSNEAKPNFTGTMRSTSERVECCSCLEELSSRFVYTTEGCGHTYCRSCMKSQMETSIQNTIFPIMCAGCNIPLPLIDITFFTKTVSWEMQTQLMQRAFSHYIRKLPEAYMECPSYRCTGIVFLKNKSENDAHHCASCKLAICLECKTLSHEGLSCKDNQEMLAEWQRHDPTNRKMCPNCKMGIQKNGGCNNVRCATCKHSICWHCLAFFKVEDECYRHLRAKHGGY